MTDFSEKDYLTEAAENSSTEGNGKCAADVIEPE